MTWATMPTFTDGAVLTATQLNTLVNNLNETSVSKATAAGRIYVSTGVNAVAERVPTSEGITTSQTTTSTSYTNLATIGPEVTVTTGTSAVVLITASVSSGTAGQGGIVGYQVTGASTVAESSQRSLRTVSASAGHRFRASMVHFEVGLSSGSNTFTCRYCTTGSGTATFDDRQLLIIPF